MLIAILNQSKLVSNADGAAMTQAIAKQVRMDVAPLWDRTAAAVIFYTHAKDVPPAAHGIARVDAIIDQPDGVLGYHTEDRGGKLWGVVAAEPELDNGGTPTKGDTPPSAILGGGYVVYAAAGAEHQRFGDESPGWPKEMKAGKFARTRRRLEQTGAMPARATA
ncbi:hypothetical protein BST11_02160 [Mycobacterium alsense]|uniref:Uncharacterized protein n=1 Tax=Mycobacterium alsense TaxID=324058 RepID=A0AA41XME2_9MYCO|nr:hypothetical protein [Mycobacterium alsense]MCV7378064.1 hypothetical protein [Mycobacterium alsense]OQZ93451.1 hypothetical protein BST11_02160 [Mycobacterium alsense]